MLRELLVSVVSGIVVAFILQISRCGGRAESRPQTRELYEPQPRRRSFTGGLMRFVFAVAGGIGIAYAVAPFLRSARHHNFGGIDHLPMLALTVAGTIVVWMLLSAMTRR